jgi:hypothetical protein
METMCFDSFYFYMNAERLSRWPREVENLKEVFPCLTFDLSTAWAPPITAG